MSAHVYVPGPPLSAFVELLQRHRGGRRRQWWMATHVEDVSKEEMERRAAEQGRG